MTRILVVEDSPTQAEMLTANLHRRGHEAVLARDAEEALRLLHDNEVDLVLSDVIMPGLSGYGLCQSIKADKELRHLPVVLLTSLRDPLDIIQGLESGADSFFTKPYDPDLLIDRIERLVESRLLRTRNRVKFGVDVLFLGHRITINSDREQILDLLISTFEDILHANRDLEKSRAELAAANAMIADYAQRLESRIRTSEERYRGLMQTANDAIFVADAETGLLLDANDAAEGLIGLPRDRLIGTHQRELHPSAEREHYAQLFKDGVRVGRTVFPDLFVQRVDGTLVPVEISANVFDSDGRSMVQGIFRDLSERRRTEERLRTLSLAVEQSANLVVVTDPDGRIQYLNPKAEMTLGYQTAEVVGQTPRLWKSDRSPREEYVRLWQSIKAGKEWHGIFQNRRRDGSLFSVAATIWPVRGTDGSITHFVGVQEDITERQALEEQLRQAQKMEAVGQLTGGIAHDFNNLLTVILGNIEFLADCVASDASARLYAEAALAAADRAAKLTAQLLAFSRKQPLDPTAVDVNRLIISLADMLKRTLEEHIDIQTMAAERLPPVLADRAQLESAILNLAVNARDAMPDGGALTIETSSTELDEHYARKNVDVCPGKYVLIAISDTGTGMPADVVEHAFEPFFTTKAVGKGTGLGLSMVYGFAKQSGGHVKIYSEVGHGTTIRLYLPVASGNVLEEETVAGTMPAPVRGGESILVVEDDPDLRTFVVTALESLGYKVQRAASGPEALAIAETAGAIDLLLTDVVLPGGMNGKEIADALRERRPDLRVLFSTGYAENAVVHHGRLLKGVQLLPKPYTRAVLARKVREVLSVDPVVSSK